MVMRLPKKELAAAAQMLDEEHINPPRHNHYDINEYIYGSINGHNVVIACMPAGQTGKVSASLLAQPMGQTFPHMRIYLFVGIAGGMPRHPP